MTSSPLLWKKKLAAWLHDPAEKALVLMRDEVGHEHGSVATLRATLGIKQSDFDKRADWYAAAADRPQWPFEADRPRPAWATVRFASEPVLIHPLSGEEINLGKLDEIHAAHIRNVSLAHFSDLIERDAHDAPDYRLTQLAFWRFGPEPALCAPDIGDLWRVLPADTRVPDHSIWAHLDTVSALTGAMDEDTPALLAMSFGPVQGFIAQARSTSDLWAGSHLLSSLVWEGLKTICESLGPDALVFPGLRGVAAVDRWLLSVAEAAGKGDAWRTRFKAIDAQWLDKPSDANPLFAATLPNKFMAIVPAGKAEALARQAGDAVRAAALRWAQEAAQQIFGDADGAHWKTQIAAQLEGFPEVHWAVAQWPSASNADGLPDAAVLREALAAFGTEGLFGEDVWKVLNREVSVEGAAFFKPNPGILYPAVHDLAERTLAAAKSVRPFAALAQHGHRCTLCGEREWLSGDAAQLSIAAGQRNETAWSAKAGQFGIKKGEHLCAVCAMKRLWPKLFAESLEDVLGEKPDRFVVSTHTMALATSLDQLANEAGALSEKRKGALAVLHGWMRETQRVTVPASLDRALRQCGNSSVDFVARRLPQLLDDLRDHPDEAADNFEGKIKDLLDGRKPETYYALIQMDGDHMGAWLAGNETAYQRKFPETWHPKVRNSLDRFSSDALAAYLGSYRPASPARHAAISATLNDFSTHVARHIVETVFKGKLLYAGGDDVLAMVSVDDLLPAMLLLRAAYSGTGDAAGLPGVGDLKGLKLGKGYVHLKGRLMLMMGSRATASIGAIVAHHQAPLSAVLRQLRLAEHAAKAHGRNAFCLRVMKRGGGEVGVTSRFWEKADQLPVLADTALGLMLRFAEALAQPDMSRRAVYRTTEWLAGLPARGQMEDDAWRGMVATNLAFQLQKQGGVVQHAREFVDLACRESATPAETARVLDHLLVTAEFFAREGRAFSMISRPPRSGA